MVTASAPKAPRPIGMRGPVICAVSSRGMLNDSARSLRTTALMAVSNPSKKVAVPRTTRSRRRYEGVRAVVAEVVFRISILRPGGEVRKVDWLGS